MNEVYHDVMIEEFSELKPLNPSPPKDYPSVALLLWFIPMGIINALLTGLAMERFCLMFCGTDPWEVPLLLAGLISNLGCLMGVPYIVAKKIDKSGMPKFQALFSIMGLVVVFGITILGHGMAIPLEEKFNNLQKSIWSKSVLKQNTASLRFQASKAGVVFVNSNYYRIDIAGELTGLEDLRRDLYTMIASEVIFGATGSELRLPLAPGAKYKSPVEVNGSSAQFAISANAPGQLVDFIKTNPNKPYKVVVVLQAVSQNYDKAETVWSSELETRQSYIPNMLETFVPDLFVELPPEAIKFSGVNVKDEFVTEPEKNWRFTITTHPKQTLCCEDSVLRTDVETTNYKTLEEYLDHLEWRGEIVNKSISLLDNSQVAVVEAQNTIMSPYRAIFIKKLNEVYSIKIDQDSGLDDLFQVYLDYYRPQTSN